jgi:UDP-N-acetylmuramate dehydrogenase
MRIEHNFSLLPYNTFGLNVFCRQFCEYSTVPELEDFIKSGALETSDWFHIGGGSNLLFLQDYDGLILHSQIKGIEIVKETAENCLVRVGSGEVWDDFVVWCVNNQLGGVENLSLIPGEAGASPVQNIGAYGVEAKDVIQYVETISAKDASSRIFQKSACRFAYRNSVFKNDNSYIVTHVVFCLQKLPFYSYNLEYGRLREALSACPEINLSQIREAVIAIRNEKLPDPKELGNAGSFFKNPVISKEKFIQLQKEYPSMPHYPAGEEEKIPAGWLIEQSGWKGKSHGQAGVYDKQALVLVNRGGATGSEIWELAGKIQKSILEKFGIQIEPEVKVVNKFYFEDVK